MRAFAPKFAPKSTSGKRSEHPLHRKSLFGGGGNGRQVRPY